MVLIAFVVPGFSLAHPVKQPSQEEASMEKLWAGILEFMRDEEGATAVEYGVLIALIIAVCIVVIEIIGTKINTAFEKVNTALP